MNPEYQKLLDVLAEQKEHSFSFREDMNEKMNGAIGELKQIGRRLDISNGRMAKQEEATHELQKADVLMGERVKNLQDSGEKTNSRVWQIIIGVVIATILAALGYIIKTI